MTIVENKLGKELLPADGVTPLHSKQPREKRVQK